MIKNEHIMKSLHYVLHVSVCSEVLKKILFHTEIIK